MKRSSPFFCLPLLCALGAQAAPDEALSSLLRLRQAGASAPLHSSFYDAAAPSAAVSAVPAASAPRPAGPALAPADAADTLNAPAAIPRGRFSSGHLGLYPEGGFELKTGRCSGCNAPREGLWYFLDEVIAVPKTGAPALVWIGSNELLEGAVLSQDGRSIALPGGEVMPFSLVPKLASNQSYYDLTTQSFLQRRTLRLRGEIVEENGARRFVARTVWPEDFRIDAARLPSVSARTVEDMAGLIQENDGGASGGFSARLLWEKTPGSRAWAGQPVMGVMLNGGQGDDDETQAGHFSYFAGRFGPDGQMSDWMFSNFYDMDLVSEKGITAALVPMDKYMADLNSGQSWYRPSDLLVAVLKDERVAARLQERFKRSYAKYYSHETLYNRATKSCAALIVDDLREEGWSVPTQGPSDPVARFYIGLITRLARGEEAAKDVAHFMSQERTRLFPRAAFESTASDLVSLAEGSAGRRLSPLESQLQEDLEALIYVRLPQIPSSRAFGRFPVGSTEEYFWRAPKDQSKWRTVPNDPRSFPPPGATP